MNSTEETYSESAKSNDLRLATVLLVAIVLFAVGVRTAASWRSPELYDEMVFGYGGWVWICDGGVLYQDLADNKPPLIFLLYGLSTKLFGPTVFPVRTAATVSVLIAGVIIGLLARSMGYRYGAVLAGFTMLVFALSPSVGAHGAYTEPFMILGTTGMVALAFWSRRANRLTGFVAAGVLGSIAFLFKQVCLLELLAVSVWLVADTQSSAQRRGGRLALLWAGFAIPLLLSIAWALKTGGLVEYFESVYGYMLVSGGAPTSVLVRIARFALAIKENVWPLLPLGLGGALFLCLRRWLPGNQRLVVLWVLFALVGPFAGWAYGHQFLQVVPPLALATIMAGSWLWRRLDGWGAMAREDLRRAAKGACIFAAFTFVWLQLPLLYNAVSLPEQRQESSARQSLAQIIRARAQTEDTLLSWHTPLMVNILSGLRSPTRHAFDWYYFRQDVAEEVIRTLTHTPPRFVVMKRFVVVPREGATGDKADTGISRPLGIRERLVDPWVEQMVARDYHLIAVVDKYLLYERKEATDTKRRGLPRHEG